MKRILFYASAVAVMFSSCSKDATEVATPSLEGKVQVFSASIDVEKNNSTRMEYDGANYIWALGDAIGVTSLSNLTNGMPETPSYNTAENTSVASFAVTDSDARHFGDWDKMGDALYFYFPYSSDGKLIKNQDGSVSAKLSIPATQRYAPNTFFKNTVPAIGYVEKYVLGESEVKMDVPVSMIELMVKGFGETDALTLKIQKPNAVGYYNLAGSQEVVIPTDGTMPVFVEPTETSDKITLSFGNQSEGFEYEGAKKVIFVVPAGLELNNATIELSNGNDTQTLLLDFMCTKTVDGVNVNDPEGSYKTQPNNVFALVKGNYDFTFGMDGKFVIEDENETAGEKWNDGYTAEEKFIAYAYLAQHQDAQNNVYPKTDDWKFIAEYLGYDIDWGTLGANVVNDSDYQALTTTIAWIKSEKNDGILDFTDYGKQWAIDQKTALNTHLVQGGQDANPSAENNFWLNVYDWYIANEGIESLSYNAIVGDDDINPIVIKGLKVQGSGLIAKSGSAVDVYGNGAKLKNLKFEDCHVICGAQAGFVGFSDSYLAKLDNVTLGADNTVESSSANAYVGGLFGTMNATSLAIDSSKLVIEELPVVVSESANKGQVAGALNNIASVRVIDLSAYNVVDGGVAFAVVNGDGNGVAMFSVPEDVELDGEVFAGVANKATASIIVDGTAYWNGNIAASDNGVAPLTAEELAYYVSQRGDNRSVNLTNNYDLQGNVFDWGNVVNATTALQGKLDVNGKISDEVNATISNVKITDVVKNNMNAYSLFGVNGSVKNVVIDGLTINVAVGGNHNYIAGLIHTASALEGISVKNAKVSVASAVKAGSTAREAAGLIAALITGNDVTISDCHTDANCAFNVGTGTTRHTNRGMLLSTIDIVEGKEYNFENCSVAIGRMIGLANVTAGTANSSDLPSVTFTDCEAKTKINKINWNGYTGNWAFMLDGNYANKSVTKY